MKIIGISGSPRTKNTDYMLKTVLDATELPYELVKLTELNINPCKACKGCHESHLCLTTDDMQAIYTKIEEADFILLGSPTYFSNVSGIMKNFMDRCLPYYFSRKLEGKNGATLAVGNFKDYLEFDESGNCKWHKEETESVKECLKALNNFANHVGIRIVESIYALHGDPTSQDEELKNLGKKIAKEFANA